MQQSLRSAERQSIGALMAASLAVLGVYAAVLNYVPLDVFWHPDEGAKYISMRTVSSEPYAVPYGGGRLDPKNRFYPPRETIYPTVARDGSIAFRWPIIFPWLSRFGYEAFGIAGIYVIPVLSGWLLATLAGVWTYLFRPRLAPLAVLLTGLATPMAFYSVTFFEHTLTSLLGAVALTVLIHRPGRLSSLLVMAPFLAAAVALRAEMVAYAAALLGTWLLTGLARLRWQPQGLLRLRRSTWLLGLATIAAVGLLGIFLAGILPERHLLFLTNVPHYVDRMWFKSAYFFDSVLRVFMGEPRFTSYAVVTVWQIAALMALGGLIAAPFADTRQMEMVLILPALIVVLQTSLLTTFHTLPFLQRQGVLAVAPFIGISLFALPQAWHRRDLRLLALASAGAFYVLLGFIAIYVTRVAEHDGSTLLGLDGPVRYMLTLYPIGAALSVLALADYSASDAPRLARLGFSAIVLSLMLVSSYYEVLSVRELINKREVLVQWRAELRPEPVATDLWWLPAVLAPYWVEHELYFVDRDRGTDDWQSFVAAQGFDAFTWASAYKTPAALSIEPGPWRERENLLLLGLNISRFQRVEQ